MGAVAEALTYVQVRPGNDCRQLGSFVLTVSASLASTNASTRTSDPHAAYPITVMVTFRESTFDAMIERTCAAGAWVDDGGDVALGEPGSGLNVLRLTPAGTAVEIPTDVPVGATVEMMTGLPGTMEVDASVAKVVGDNGPKGGNGAPGPLVLVVSVPGAEEGADEGDGVDEGPETADGELVSAEGAGVPAGEPAAVVGTSVAAGGIGTGAGVGLGVGAGVGSGVGAGVPGA